MSIANPTFKSVDDYISTFPQETRQKLDELRTIIHKEAPDVKETIRYDMPTFTINDTYLVYFAAWKKHISLYPYTVEMEKEFPETAEYKTSGKGTIQLPLDKPLPVELVRKIVQYRLQEIQK